MFKIEKFETLEAQQARIQEIIVHEMFTLQNQTGFEEIKGTPVYGFCPLDKEYIFDLYEGETFSNAVRRHNLYSQHKLRDFDIEEKLPKWEGVGTYFRGVIISYEAISYEAGWDKGSKEFYVVVPDDLPATSENWVEE